MEAADAVGTPRWRPLVSALRTRDFKNATRMKGSPMNRPILTALLGFTLALLPTRLFAQPPQAAPPPPTAFVNVTVIPLEGPRYLPAHTVVVEGRRITRIGPAASVDIPPGAVRIDGAGKFLIPGLAEMHAHIPSPPQADNADIDRVLLLFVANGITTVRGMLGHESHLRLRDEVARGERLGPQIFTSGPSLNGRSVPDVETARRLVTEQRAAGYDLLKIHPGLSRATYDAIAATAAAEGIPFAGHVPVDVGLERALAAGQATIEHLDGYLEAMVVTGAPVDPRTSAFFGFNLLDHIDESRIVELAAATARAGSWVAPTQVLFENRFLGDPAQTGRRPEMRYVAANTVTQWVNGTLSARQRLGYDSQRAQRFIEIRRQLIKALHDAGAGILLGADAPQVFNVPGFATIQELTALVEAGLTPYEALLAGARNPAVQLGRADSFGTVAAGKRADLVLLDADPLIAISNARKLSGVMVAGRWLPSEEIALRLGELAASR